MFGWTGTILRVDLSKEKIWKESIDLEFAKNWLGGRGFNSKILYDEFDPSVRDPYDPKNIICVGCGLLNATSVPACRHTTISVGRSPVTSLFGDSGIGGHFGPELKMAGYETIVIYGKAKKPVYLWIKNEQVDLRDAGHLWGEDTWETEKILKNELRDEAIKELSIGPAGENKVAYSAVIHCDNRTGEGGSRAASKVGAGAVFGSKNLKAIAVRGTRRPALAKEKEFNRFSSEVRKRLICHDPLMNGLGKYGTQLLTEAFYGMLPVKDYQFTTIEGIENLYASRIRETHPLIRSRSCYGCPLPHCNNFYRMKDGTEMEGPQYQSIASLGPQCGNVESDSVMESTRLCNRLGVDSVNAGNVIGLLMHWWQDGILSAEDADGLILEWGNASVMTEIIRKMAYREGFGDVIADGAFVAAERIAKKKGLNSEKLESYIVHVKKMFVPSTELRPAKGIAFSYATSTRGADHLRGITKLEVMPFLKAPEDLIACGYPREIAEKCIELKCTDMSRYEGKGYAVKFIEDGYSAFASAGICLFVTFYNLNPYGVEDLARLVTLATGETYTWKDIMACGERITNIEKAMQIRMGAGRKDDLMPPRYFEEKIPDGPFKGGVIEKEKYNKMLDEYYEYREWNKEGVPTKEKLEKLGLQYVAKDLEVRGLI